MRQAKLGDFMAKRSRGIVPASMPDETFELYSVPAFETKRPEIVTGAEMGSNKQVVEPGTVLLCKINPRINRAWTVGSFTNHQKIASTEWITFPRHPDVEPRYLANYLSRKEIRDYLAANASGVGGSLMRVKASTVEDLPLPLPNVAEQRRIVAELEEQFSRLDEAIVNLKRVKANLKRYKAAVLDAAVKGRVQSEGAASTDELPAGWQWAAVGELARVGTGATPKRSNEAFWGGTIPWITSSAVNEPFVDAADQFVTDDALRQTNLTLYPPGTLLVAMYGEGKTRGKCSELRIAATTNQALAALQVDPDVRSWLKLFLEHNYDNTRRIASGGVQPNLNLGLIRAIKLPLPPPEDQRRIVAEVDRRLSIVREAEAEVDANLKRVQALRQAVLAKAFSAHEAAG
jgi:type I restriction enzyme S subunit